jgi:hypothetical protein
VVAEWISNKNPFKETRRPGSNPGLLFMSGISNQQSAISDQQSAISNQQSGINNQHQQEP